MSFRPLGQVLRNRDYRNVAQNAVVSKKATFR
jgi:hypothetical protein